MLKLNEYNLCKARRLIIRHLNDALNGGYFDYIVDNYNDFHTLVNFYKESQTL